MNISHTMALFDTGLIPDILRAFVFDSPLRDENENDVHFALNFDNVEFYITDIINVDGILFFEIRILDEAIRLGKVGFPENAKTITQMRKEATAWKELNLIEDANIFAIHSTLLNAFRKHILATEFIKSLN